MSGVVEQNIKTEQWHDEIIYKRVSEEIDNSWPNWKKQVYNEMFAFSAHAGKVVVKK